MDKVARLVVDGVDVAPVVVADTFGRRLRGMLGRHPLPEALILVPSNSVHGVGMRDALDVAVLDRQGAVLAVTVLRPLRLTRTVKHGRQVLEAPVGSFGRWGLGPGSQVSVVGPA